MPEVKIAIQTPEGERVGAIINPEIKQLDSHDYAISGTFVDSEGNKPDRVEFNPEVLPYTIILEESLGMKCNHKKLLRGYIQRGRQPVMLTARCEEEKIDE